MQSRGVELGGRGKGAPGKRGGLMDGSYTADPAQTAGCEVLPWRVGSRHWGTVRNSPQLLATARPCTPLHCPHRSRGDGPASIHSWRGLRERGLREDSATWGSFTLEWKGGTNKMPPPPPPPHLSKHCN
jgi:hypothetical protein